MEIAQSITILAGTAFLAVGAVYRYRIRHFPLTIGDGLTLIVLSYMAAAGLALVLRGIDFVIFNSRLFGEKTEDIKVLVIIGSIAGFLATYYYFRDFLKRRG